MDDFALAPVPCCFRRRPALSAYSVRLGISRTEYALRSKRPDQRVSDQMEPLRGSICSEPALARPALAFSNAARRSANLPLAGLPAAAIAGLGRLSNR